MILIEPSANSLDVSETFLIENESTTTFQDPVKGSIQFYLPEAAGGKVERDHQFSGRHADPAGSRKDQREGCV